MRSRSGSWAPLLPLVIKAKVVMIIARDTAHCAIMRNEKRDSDTRRYEMADRKMKRLEEETETGEKIGKLVLHNDGKGRDSHAILCVKVLGSSKPKI